MKNYIVALILLFIFIQCDKKTVSEVTSELESVAYEKADSLVKDITKQTLDSVASPILDSLKQSVSKIPQSVIDSAGSTLRKSLDSVVTNVIKPLPTPKEPESQTVPAPTKEVPQKEKLSQNGVNETITKIIYRDRPRLEQEPVYKLEQIKSIQTKTAQLEIRVDNISDESNHLYKVLEEQKGYVVSDNQRENDSIQTKTYQIQVPLSHFDGLIDNLSMNFGEVKTKTIDVHGEHYQSNTVCNIQLTFNQISPKEKSFFSQIWGGFIKGGSVIGDIVLALIPFWPLGLLAGFGLWYWNKKYPKQKKDQE